MKNFVFIFLFFSTHGLAQDSTNKISGIITRKTLGAFKMDGKRIAESDVKTEIYKVPAAIPFYKKTKTSKIIGCSFIVPIALFAFLGNDSRNNYRDSTGHFHMPGNQIGLLLSEGGFLYFFFHSISLSKKAIRIRNAALKPAY